MSSELAATVSSTELIRREPVVLPAPPDRSVCPVPRCAVSIRTAVPADMPFIDALQKRHRRMVGWSPRKQLEEKIEAGQVLIAADEQGGAIGYCIAQDRYMRRDDVGIIYQLNVLPTRQRHLIGAALVKATFERAAYGCRLFCCWCAQDIPANHFWQAMGFLPLAFRTGNRGTKRMHIFWQRRINAGDCTTPYWYPTETSGGSMRENRIVLPIPPGLHWQDEMPIVLPEAQEPAIPGVRRSQQPKPFQGVPAGKMVIILSGRLRYVDRPGSAPAAPAAEKHPSPRRPSRKNDPVKVAAARELRDRYLEQLNHHALPSNGKYDVSPQQAPDLQLR